MNTPHRDTQLIAALSAALDRANAPDVELVTCGDCGATWWGYGGESCDWCARYKQADAEHVLRPPAPRGYGYATGDDLVKLGVDPEAERAADLERWGRDMEMAIDAGLITQEEADGAWRKEIANDSGNRNPIRRVQLPKSA